MSSISDKIKEKPWLGWVLFLGTMGIVFVLGLFASEVTERRAEATVAYAPNREIDQFDPRNSVWGKAYPREYESWKATEDTTFKSKHMSSAREDMLEKNPNLVILWAGYGFSKEYNTPRGHYYAITDLQEIQRTGAPTGPNDGPMPSTCWTCKSPDVPRLMNEKGVAEFYKGKWASKGSEVVNPIGCGDCHDSKTMDLRISRPALIEGMKAMGKDINKATNQEMRSLVCAQCHVEYYFDGSDKSKGKYLTFPWKEGQTVEDMERYYDNLEFKDWTHKISRAPMLKAQHPGYEIYKMGIHGQRGVSCADCHMPYTSEGGVKFTDHQINSPLAKIDKSCQVCHREDAEELKSNVYANQDRVDDLKMRVEPLIVKAHYEAGKAWELGATEAEMKPILKLIRHAQWRWDYAVASHGASAHAPVEMTRVLGSSLDKAQEARMLLARLLATKGFIGEVEIPDISTKEKAQRAIGLDPDKMRETKDRFLKTLVPEWIKKAEERHSKLQPRVEGGDQIPHFEHDTEKI
ncbi:cytochrome c-552 (plasmid) [Fulvitalea axinellae]|uniref:Cytochrome c-552 n=1 Tax=Fulvitalea axinellae TaxID=1182444 RepID=A0AAU9CGW6_9BACT|nr:cytochrome c-552 [Fulvitalea axinellae]